MGILDAIFSFVGFSPALSHVCWDRSPPLLVDWSAILLFFKHVTDLHCYRDWTMESNLCNKGIGSWAWHITHTKINSIFPINQQYFLKWKILNSSTGRNVSQKHL